MGNTSLNQKNARKETDLRYIPVLSSLDISIIIPSSNRLLASALGSSHRERQSSIRRMRMISSEIAKMRIHARESENTKA